MHPSKNLFICRSVFVSLLTAITALTLFDQFGFPAQGQAPNKKCCGLKNPDPACSGCQPIPNFFMNGKQVYAQIGSHYNYRCQSGKVTDNCTETSQTCTNISQDTTIYTPNFITNCGIVVGTAGKAYAIQAPRCDNTVSPCGNS